MMNTLTMVRFIFRETPASEEFTSFEKEFPVDDAKGALREIGLEG